MSRCSCCYCAYLNPPWWVTTGYAPRHDFQGQPPVAFQPPPVIGQPPPDQPPPVIGQPPPDQPPPVIGQPPPDQLPPVIGQGLVIAGTVSILQTSGLAAAAGATVGAYRRADDAMVATTTTDAAGNFSLTVPTGGMPFDVYLTLTMSGLIPARVYVWRAPTNSIQIGNVFLTSSATLSSLFQTIGLTASAAQSTVIVLVRDSVLSAVQVDRVNVSQNGTPVGYLFDPSSLGISGVGTWTLNVPPAPTEVSATSKETLFGPAQITAIQGQMTFAILIDDQTQPAQPGRQDITVGDIPISLAFDGTNIWSINQGSVSIVSASDGSFLGTFLVGSGPSAAVSVGTMMWVASSTSPGDPDHGSFTSLSPFGSIGQIFNVVQQPTAMAAVQDPESGPLLYFVELNSDTLWRFFPTTGQVNFIGSTRNVGAQVLLFDGAHFWITNSFNNTVSKVDKNTGASVSFPVGNGPNGLAFDGNSIWVTNFNDNTISKLSVNDGQILQTIATGLNPGGIAFDGANLWVANWGSNTLTQIRATDGAVLGNLPTGLNPASVVFDGAHIWVANSGTNTISKY